MQKLSSMFLIAALTLFAMTVHQAASAGKPAALIVKVKSDVKVQRSGKQKSVKGKFALLWGDKLIVTKGSSALLLFANGKKVTATSDFDITEANAKIGVKKNTAVSSAAGVLVELLASLDKDADLKAKGGVGGTVRGAADDGPKLQLISYLNTSTMDTRPVFKWEASDEAEKTTVILMNEDGDEVINAEADGYSLEFPEGLAGLEPGLEYTIEVIAMIGGKKASMTSTFYILDEDEAKEISKAADAIKKEYKEGDDLYIQHMLLAEIYRKNQLFMDAEGELKKLLALNEKDLSTRYDLAQIYNQTGNEAAAASQRKWISKQKEAEAAPPDAGQL